MPMARKPKLTPAIQALLLQIAALLMLAAAQWSLAALSPASASASATLPLPVFFLLQGGLAAALSAWRGLARWWLPIQLLFPIVAWLVSAWQLPPAVFLGGFLFFLLLFWSTYRTQVPYYPSTAATWRAVEALLPQTHPVRLIDIGSGLGGPVLSLARRHPQSRFDGIEIAPLPWLVSWLRAWAGGRRARFSLGDYARLDFAEYDVVFAYLSPAAMTELGRKARAEMRAGSLLLSYEFPILGWPHDIAVKPSNKEAILYGWRL